MKKIYTILKIAFLPLLFIFIIGFNFSGEVNTAVKEIVIKKGNYAADLVSKASNNFVKTSLFSLSTKDNSKILNEFTSAASFLTLDREEITKVYYANNKNIVFKIPVSTDNNIELELTQINIFTEDFSVNSSEGKTLNYNRGLYYHGIIKGDNNSMAAISIFENSVMGIISNDEGNYVIGSIKDNNKNYTNDYIFYNDNDLIIKNNFKCEVDDVYGELYKGSVYKYSPSQKDATTDPIRVRFVADYTTYVDAGSNQTTLVNFVTAMFNNTKLIYANETIPVELSNIKIHTSQDPYLNYTSSIKILQVLGTVEQDDFVGDLTQLISTRTDQNFGGIAWVNVLCQSFYSGDSSGRFSFANIEGTFNIYPLYSWTVMVVTHELGHNIGSMHTHACVWPISPGVIGAVDSCVAAEGTCFAFTRPNNNGTIMSYCHLNGNINFNRGFGPLPGDTIRYAYSLAACIDSALNSSEVPLAFNLLQNYPNPFNPSTTITFALPEEGFVSLTVFDVTGKEVTQLLREKSYKAGVFRTSFNTGEHNLSSGVYLYKLEVRRNNGNIYSEIKKMVLLK